MGTPEDRDIVDAEFRVIRGPDGPVAAVHNPGANLPLWKVFWRLGWMLFWVLVYAYTAVMAVIEIAGWSRGPG